MRKLILAAGGAAVAGATAVTLGLGLGLGIGLGHADNGNANSTLNVVGETYAKAVAILRAQGVKATFGGSVGSDLPQAQCVVASEKVLTASRHIQLNLDCTAPDGGSDSTSSSGTSGAQSTAAATDGARPTPGAPGVVTVAPKQVG